MSKKSRNHRFEAFIDSFPVAMPTLPVVHVTSGRAFINIIDEMQISVGETDSVLNKQTSFHFYGKPSYRPRFTDGYSAQFESCLFCIVMSITELPKPSSILPFDSGCYQGRTSILCDNIPIGEYFLRPEMDQPGRFVSAFFGDNSNYIDLKLRNGVSDEVAQFDLHSHGFIRICSHNATVSYDQRAATIELHYDKPIYLNKNNVVAIIGPDIAIENHELIEFALKLGAELVPYTVDLEEPMVRQRQVRDAYVGWLVGSKFYMSA